MTQVNLCNQLKGTILCNEITSNILLQTAILNIVNPENHNFLQIRAFFDVGSQFSYLSKNVANTLKLNTINSKEFVVSTFGSKDTKLISSELVEIILNKNNFNFEMKLFTANFLCNPLESISFSDNQLRELNQINLADPEVLQQVPLEIDLLIGCDYYWKLIDTSNIIFTNAGPTAVMTQFGFVLSGPVYNENHHFNNNVYNYLSYNSFTDNYPNNEEKRLDCIVERFWSLDSLGILPELDQNIVLEVFHKTIKFSEGEHRYYVNLPWKSNLLYRLNDNKQYAEKRLDSILKKLNKDNFVEGGFSGQQIISEIEAIFQSQLNEGIISRVEETAVSGCDDSIVNRSVHYIPIQYVIKSGATTSKVRVVYDGSNKGKPKNASINEFLYSGPPLQINMAAILIRWRMFPIAINSDIRHAFLQIKLDHADRDALRFVWKEGGRLDSEITIFKCNTVIFGLKSSPFLLNATICHHLEKNKDKHAAVSKLNLLHSFYVDDLLTGTYCKETAISGIRDTVKLMSDANFKLHKFVSNDPVVYKFLCDSDLVISSVEEGSVSPAPSAVSPAESAEQLVPLAGGSLDVTMRTRSPHTTALGYTWKYGQDTIMLHRDNARPITEQPVLTKRHVLSIIAHIHDPLGIVGPVLIKAKIFFQTLCKLKCDWNEKIPDGSVKEFLSIQKDLEKLYNFEIPRYVFYDAISGNNLVDFDYNTPVTLNCYCDASNSAYCASIYLGFVDNNNVARQSLIFSKTRVAPLQKYSIPRKELLASVLGVRLVKTVKEMLSLWNIAEINYFTDSLNVLYWIRSHGKAWAVFVENRLLEIHENTRPFQWKYVPSSLNPSDLGTRGISYEQFVNSDLWFHGPKSISSECTNNPIFSITSECEAELRKPAVQLVSKQIVSPNIGLIKGTLSLKNFSSFEKLISVSSNVLKAIQIMKKEPISSPKDLSERSLLMWIRSEQIEHFKEEILFASDKPPKPTQKTPTPLMKQLGLYLDKDLGVLRCMTRLSRAQIPHETKYPILLSNKSHLTSLIIHSTHEKLFHSGVGQTLASLRIQYWVIKGRRTVTSTLKSCMLCRKLNANPYSPPEAPQLPKFRLEEMPAFTQTGLDFAGPFQIKCDSGKKLTKAYICLFTCAVSRGIHVEFISSMSAACFLLALKRFVGRRGAPFLIYSDNFSTFKRMKKELNNVINDDIVQKYSQSKRVTWKFSVVNFPQTNGFTEICVKLVKKALNKTLGKTLLNYEEMSSLLTEIEGVVNSRPLVLQGDVDIEFIPLTPSMLMTGKTLTALPPLKCMIDNNQLLDDSVFLTKRLKYLELLQVRFWNAWKSDYLQELTSFHFNLRARNKHDRKTPKVGEIVIVEDPNLSRNEWKMGKIVELIKSDDDKIRQVKIQPATSTQGDKRRNEFIYRSITHVYPLELRVVDNDV